MRKATGNKNGRPPFFDTPEEFEKACQGYYKKCIRDEEPMTITGLAMFLGFESRQSFYDYEKKEGFTYAVKKNRLKIENSYERALLSGGNPAGPIFALKNMGWSDRQETQLTINRELTEEELKKRIAEIDQALDDLED